MKKNSRAGKLVPVTGTLALLLVAAVSFGKTKEKNCLELGTKGVQGGVPSAKGWILTRPCCKPWVDREPKDIEPSGGGYRYICLACGDGTCDKKYEDKKNCPEDCK
jgi:hypothetical protein